MKNRFSIGEMAKLHNTTIKTLRYYDKIGLLKPVQIGKTNGYRYYSTEQFEQLNIINYLKSLGVTLEEIKNQLEHRDIDAFLQLLRKQKECTEMKIQQLQKITNQFRNRIEDIEKTKAIQRFEYAYMKEFHERKIVQLKEKITSEADLEVSLRILENMANMSSTAFIGGVGLTIAKEQILIKNFKEYNSVFILLEDDERQNGLVRVLKEGKYVCIVYKGNHNDSPKYYKLLLDYIVENELQIIGDSIERTIIDHYISKNPDDYITEIQIPVSCLTLP